MSSDMPISVVIRVKSGNLPELLAEIRAKGGCPIQAFAPSHVIAVPPPVTRLDLGEIVPSHTRAATFSEHLTSARQAGVPALSESLISMSRMATAAPVVPPSCSASWKQTLFPFATSHPNKSVGDPH